MQFTVEREPFLEAVSRLSRIVSNRTSYPVLEGIFLSAEQGRLTMISYNLEISLKKVVYARTVEDGEIVLSARLLSDIIRRMESTTVELRLDEKKKCRITGGSAVFEIETMDAADFPEMPSFIDGKQLNIFGKELLEMTSGTSFAVAPVEGSRPILMGINISVTDNLLKFVAIDGFRLAIRRLKIANSENMNFVISGKSLDEIIRLITNPEEEIQILIGSKMISFTVNGYHMVCRLMEGDFVDYERTIPKEFKQRLVVKVQDILSILERISLLISDSFSTPVRCYMEEEQIIFNCVTGMGKITETYQSDLEGDPFEIGLSSRYLTEALKATGDDMVQIKFDGSRQGIVITPLSGDDYMYMIMPMRLSNNDNR